MRALPGVGDFLCAVPALRALRAALPGASVTLVGLGQTRALVDRFPHYIDELLEFPGFPGLPEQPARVRALPAFLIEAHEREFDLAIQLHGSGVITNPFTLMMGARQVAGFYLPGQLCPDPQRFYPYPAHEPEVRRYLQLMDSLGMALQGEHLEFPIRVADRFALDVLRDRHRFLGRDYACLHVGATEPRRRWPADRFAAVADALTEDGLSVALTGSKDEQPLTAEVAGAARHPMVDLAGATPLGVLAALLQGARLLVTNDTGVSHLAAAVGTPSVIVFTTTDPDRWAPLDRARHRPVGRPPGGNPCRHDQGEPHRCLRDGCCAGGFLASSSEVIAARPRGAGSGPAATQATAVDAIGSDLEGVEATPAEVVREARALLALSS